LRPFPFTFFFIVILNPAIAQKTIPEFGKITKEELIMKECAFEKNAGAMNLFVQAKISFKYNDFNNVSSNKFEYSARIKIFNSLGFTAANIKIHYISNSNYSSVTDVEAYAYSLNSTGEIVKEKLNRKDILRGATKEKNAESYIAFAFPNIKPGDVIEYKYTRTEKNSFYLEPWFFQDLIPTAISKVTAIVPTYKKVTYYVSATDSVSEDSAYRKYEGGLYNEETRSFMMHNIHSFKPEPLMTSIKDNLERVEFSIPGFIYGQAKDGAQKMRFYTYDLLDAWSFGLQFKRPIHSLDHFIDSVKQLNHTTAIVEAIYQLVKSKVDWNGDQSFFCEDSVDGCWNTKSGSSAEMNLLFLNLLRKAGVKCNPVLVSTRENGMPDMNFASLSQFNGVDVLIVDNKNKYVVDCTQKYLSSAIPPHNILNSYGYIVDRDQMGWMLIMDHRILNRTEIYVDASMDTTGNVKGKAETSFIGFAKYERLKEIKEKKENSADPDFTNNNPELICDTMLVEHLEPSDDSLALKLLIHFKPPSTGKFYFLKPFIFSSFDKNPFIENVRYSDIDFGSSQSYFTEIRIKLPLNVSVEGLPKDIALFKNDSAMSFVRKIVIENNYLLIKNHFEIKRALFIKEDYSDVKLFFDKFYATLNDQIILKRD
jgi:Domain of Unknown Function with PDB structure (DUF3857)